MLNVRVTSKLLLVLLLIAASASVAYAERPNPGVAELQADRLWFEPNRGQVVDSDLRTRPDVLYTADLGDVRLFVRKNGLSYVFVRSIPLTIAEAETSLGLEPDELSADVLPTSRTETFRVDVEFEGASAEVLERGDAVQHQQSNYYLGHCKDGITDLPHFGEVVLGGLYENIDLRLHFDGRQFKYDFIVHPGGDWSDISMRVIGADKLALLDDGRLRVDNPFGWMVEDAPVSWQLNSAVDAPASGSEPRRGVASRFVLDKDLVTFDLGRIDKQKKLIIDPGVVFSTYLGGSSTDLINDVATDSQRRIYIIGDVNSVNLPVTAGVIQRDNAGSLDAMVGRYSLTGSLDWLTYFGDTQFDRGLGITVNRSDELGICGATDSENFPVTPGGVQDDKRAVVDAWVGRMSETGRLRWATFMGSERADAAHAIAADSSDNFCVVGETADNSTTFPLRGERFSNKDANFRGGFVARLGNNTGSLLFSTYYTTPENDQSRGVAVDRNGDIFVVGHARAQMPVNGNDVLERDYMGSDDIIISKWGPSGRFLLATHFGTTDFERAWDVAVQPESGNIVVVGETGSGSFPLLNPLQNTPAVDGNSTGFVTIIDNDLENVLFSTLIETSSNANIRAVAVNRNDESIVVTGWANGTGLLVSDDAEQAVLDAGTGDRPDAFVWHLAADGSELLFGTFYGSSQDERGLGVAIDKIGNYVIGGQTTSIDLAMVNGEQITSNGSQEGFLRKYGCEITTEISADSDLEFCEGGSVVLSAGDGFASYRWNTGSEEQSIEVDATGDYFVTVSDGSGCEFTTPPTAVSVFPIPDPVITADGPTELCNGESVVLDAGTGFASYKWSNDAETQTISVDATDEYFVVVRNEGGCEAETSIKVDVRPTPRLGLEPSELDWGVLDGCESSVSRSITLTNSNAFQVRLTELQFSNSAEFAASNFTANSALEPGETISLEIVFTPSTTTPVSAELRVLLSPCDAVVTIPLSGSKGELLVTAAPSNIDFGALLLCDSGVRDTTIVFSNSGNDDVVLQTPLTTAPFSVLALDRLPLTVAPGETDSLVVRFAPAGEGTANLELTVPYTSGSCNGNLRFPLSGAARDPEVTVRDAAALAVPRIDGCEEFGDADLLLELEAGSIGPLIITEISDASGQITGQQAVPISLTAADLVRLPLRLTPTAEGVVTGSATISYELDGCSKTLTFDYTGEKRGISITVPETVDFGTYVACAEVSSTERVQIIRSGDNIVVSDIEINGDFGTNLLRGQVPPDFFEITFATDSDDDVRGSMIITFGPCDIRREIELIGRRVDLSMSGPDTQAFGAVTLGGTANQTVIWTNDGTAEILIESIDCLAAPFTLLSPAASEFPQTIAVGATLALEVAFNPTASGEFSGELCVNSPDPCGLIFRTALSGTGDEDIVLPGTIDLSFPDLVANPHDAGLDIPILVSEGSQIDAGTIVSVRAFVRLNSSVFLPRSVNPGSIANAELVGGERQLILEAGPLEIIPGAPLLVLQGVPLLGDQVTSELSLDSVQFVGANLSATLANGSLTLDSLCEVAGPRLLTTATAFGITALQPNPASGIVEISLSGIDTHGAQIELLDMSGRSILQQEIAKTVETPILQLQLDGVPAGSYWLVLRSLFRNDIKQLLVVE